MNKQKRSCTYHDLFCLIDKKLLYEHNIYYMYSNNAWGKEAC